MYKKLRKYLTEIIIGTLIVLISSAILYQCEPKGEECDKKEKVIYGTIIDGCNWNYIKQADINTSTIVIKKSASDEYGKFEIILKDCGEKNNKFRFSKKGYEDHEEFFKIDFDNQGDQNIGEIKLQPSTNCSDCDTITQIIYTLIDDKVKKTNETVYRLKKGTISLDKVFENELRNNLKPFLEEDKLNNIKDVCSNSYELVKWLDRQTIKNYNVGEYEIPSGQKVLINMFLDRIRQKQKELRINYSEINCIGAADHQGVTAIKLDRNQTGIDFPITDPFNVYYDGCESDISRLSIIPVEFGDTAPNNVSLGKSIENNCALSAVRAFITAKYIKEKLDGNTKIFYTAEGSIGNSGDNPESRRVRIEITFKGTNSALKQ
jgi:hypothetical protein